MYTLQKVVFLASLISLSLHGMQCDDRTPEEIKLYSLAEQGKLKKMQNLFAKNPTLNVDSTDCLGRTPLHAAALRGHAEVAYYLVKEKNANLEAQTTHLKKTPLHVAAFKGYKVTAQCLRDLGANQHAQTNRGKTACDLAVERGHANVAELFER